MIKNPEDAVQKLAKMQMAAGIPVQTVVQNMRRDHNYEVPSYVKAPYEPPKHQGYDPSSYRGD